MTESDPVAIDATSSTEPPEFPAGEIIAPPDSWFRKKWLLIGVALLAGAGWFLYDGYVGYPKQNAKELALGHAPPNNETSIGLQKIIGYGLIPLGSILLMRALHLTRGQYRLTEDNTLHVPGHPPVPLDAIRSIDQAKWDRKGLAFIEYELNGKAATVKLDDFAYERTRTDQIHDRLVAAIAPPTTESV